MSNNKARIFGKTADGEYEIRFLTTDDIEEAFDVLRNSFFLKENICRATDICLPESVEAKKELEIFGRNLLEDGISLVAKHIQTNKIAAVAFNKILYIPDPDEETFLENIVKSLKTPNMKTVIKYLESMDSKYDIFKQWNIDCVFEIMFLATLPQFERKGLGRTLCTYSINLAKELSQGIGNDELPNGKIKMKRPKAVTSLFTSIYSQKIGKLLGFQILADVPYTEFSFNGKTFAEKIGPLHPSSKLTAIKL